MLVAEHFIEKQPSSKVIPSIFNKIDSKDYKMS